MILTTTAMVEGRPVSRYLGLVSGEAIMGASVVKDIFAGVRDIMGGRSGSYEAELRQAKQIAIDEMTEQARGMGANAVLGVDLDYETIGGSMLMVAASGTAVVLG